jgi:hypothetical protein
MLKNKIKNKNKKNYSIQPRLACQTQNPGHEAGLNS